MNTSCHFSPWISIVLENIDAGGQARVPGAVRVPRQNTVHTGQVLLTERRGRLNHTRVPSSVQEPALRRTTHTTREKPERISPSLQRTRARRWWDESRCSYRLWREQKCFNWLGVLQQLDFLHRVNLALQHQRFVQQTFIWKHVQRLIQQQDVIEMTRIKARLSHPVVIL